MNLPGFFAGAVSFLLTAALAGQAWGVSVEDMFRNPEFSQVSLSPDGKYIAAIVRTRQAPQARNLAVMEIAAGTAKVITGYVEQDVRSYLWATDKRLVFKLDSDFDEANQTGFYRGTYSLLRTGKGGRTLHEPYARDSRSLGASAQSVGGLLESIRIVDDLPGDRGHVLVYKIDRRYLFPDAYRMDIKSGKMTKAAANDSNVIAWHADNDGQVRAAVDLGDLGDDQSHLLYRDNESSDWRTLLDFPNGDLTVLGFDKDSETLFVAARHDRDRFALYQMDPANGRLGEPVLEDPVYDINGEFSDRFRFAQQSDGRVAYLQYMADRPRQVFFEKQWKLRQLALDQALPDTVNTIIDWDEAMTRFLVQSWSDRHPSSYYLYDESSAKLKFLLSDASWLDPGEMSPMEPVSFEARDGERIHAYLTVPADTIGPAPLIIHPHGGPYGIRDEWGFNRDVQFLASRGYAVLQVNYRGSGGYGSRFESIGYKRWGLEMQDDLTDAVTWAIEEGIADPQRVAIYGASYGGYATMMGLVKTPDLYKCGINYVGVVDIPMQIRHWSEQFNVTGGKALVRDFIDERIGNGPADAARLAQTSPLNHIDKIKAPLLVVHGRLDPRVNIDQYEQLVDALKRHDKPYEAMMKRHEGHGFLAEQNKIELYGRIEEFLAARL